MRVNNHSCAFPKRRKAKLTSAWRTEAGSCDLAWLLRSVKAEYASERSGYCRHQEVSRQHLIAVACNLLSYDVLASIEIS